jgi:glycosyltransferase involved in cell wall biosynthesis
MKAVGFLQAFNERVTGNIERCITNLKSFCDDIVAYDDGSTDGTYEYLKDNCTKVIRAEKNDWLNELHHKGELLSVALELQPDFIIWADCDEIFQHNMTHMVKKALDLAVQHGCDGIDFREVNLWKSLSWCRLDNQYNDGVFCRAWRNNGKLSYSPKTGHHLSQVPQGVGRTFLCTDINIIHYGFSSTEKIQNKYNRYKELGQSGYNLQRLIDERTLKLAPVPREWLPENPEPELMPTSGGLYV